MLLPVMSLQGQPLVGRLSAVGSRCEHCPQFTMPPADRAAVIAFLSRRPEKPSTVASGELTQRVIDRTMHCLACHQRNGGGGEPLQRTLTHYRGSQPLAKLDPITPPDLSGVGLRIGRPWMLETLAGNSPSSRPWLSVKMPSYGLSETDRNRIALRLAAADEIPDLASPGQITVFKEFEAMAPVLIGPHRFNCVNCHFLGSSTYQATNSAPDLTLATRRVSGIWFHRWLSSPSRILRSTPMPAFVKPVPRIAGDDLTVQEGDRLALPATTSGRQRKVARDSVESLPPRSRGLLCCPSSSDPYTPIRLTVRRLPNCSKPVYDG